MEFINHTQLKELQSQGEKLLVDITATWCGPCKVLVPKLEKMESDYTNVKFVKLNADENRDYLIEMGVSSVPTVMMYRGDNLISRTTGIQPDSFYKEVLKNL